jgi:hypothetical protein
MWHSGRVSPVEVGEGDVRSLVAALSSARDAAEALAGRRPLGLRAVEPSSGRRSYLCAFEGPAFLCLTGAMRAEGDLRRAREAASASLLWEHLEAMVDADALRELAGSIGRVLALGRDPAEVTDPLAAVAARALELAAWRDAPIRALASLPRLDEGVALQERLVGAYALFVRASEPLVERQESLDQGLVVSLRAVEESAARAGAPERLADRLAAAIPACEEGADEMMAVHITRLG